MIWRSWEGLWSQCMTDQAQWQLWMNQDWTSILESTSLITWFSLHKQHSWIIPNVLLTQRNVCGDTLTGTSGSCWLRLDSTKWYMDKMWTTPPPIASSCQELTICGICRTECYGRSKCSWVCKDWIYSADDFTKTQPLVTNISCLNIVRYGLSVMYVYIKLWIVLPYWKVDFGGFNIHCVILDYPGFSNVNAMLQFVKSHP